MSTQRKNLSQEEMAQKYLKTLEKQRHYYQEHKEQRLAYQRAYWKKLRDAARKGQAKKKTP